MLKQISDELPNLALVASTGFISDQNFELLGMLIPSVEGEVERGNFAERCSCGENKALCRGRKLAHKRHVHVDDVAEFSRCILDARRYGNELDEISCYF